MSVDLSETNTKPPDDGQKHSVSTVRHLFVETVRQDEAWPQVVLQPMFCDRIAFAIEQFLEFDGIERAVVAFADDNQVKELNRRFRGKDQPTNVLSFPAPEHARSMNVSEASDGVAFLGDIILARETVLKEAEEQATPFDHHVAHLIVHGILHLVGYDHETRVAAEDMEALEIEILAHLDIDNPYTEELVDAG